MPAGTSRMRPPKLDSITAMISSSSSSPSSTSSPIVVADVLRRRVAATRTRSRRGRPGQATRCSAPRPARPACSVRRPRWRRRRGARRRRTRAAPTPATACTAWPRVMRSARGSSCSWVPRKSAVTRGDDAAAHDAVGVDDPGLGHLGDAEGDGDRAVLVVDDRPVAALAGEELLDVRPGRRRRRPCRTWRRRAARPAARRSDQLGVLLLARHAARLEEVDDDPVALAAGQLERRAVGAARRSPRAPAGPSAACPPSRRSTVGAGEHDEQPGDARRRWPGRRTGRCRRSGHRTTAAHRSLARRLARLTLSVASARSHRAARRRRPAPTRDRSGAGARAGERRQQRADGHHRAADPQPHDQRLDEHADRRRRVAPGAAPRSSVR